LMVMTAILPFFSYMMLLKSGMALSQATNSEWRIRFPASGSRFLIPKRAAAA
jgi:hypothetical protein